MRGIADMGRRLDRFTQLSVLVGFTGLVLLALITCADVLGRWLFSVPIDGVDDLSQLAFAVIIASCLPAGLLRGENVTIRFLGKAAGVRAGYWLEALGAVLVLVFFGFIAWQLAVLTFELGTSGDTTMTVRAVTWPWWLVTTLLVTLCIPTQIFVCLGHARRAVRGGGPGGTIHLPGEADQGHGSV